jgi:hypothetical protein
MHQHFVAVAEHHVVAHNLTARFRRLIVDEAEALAAAVVRLDGELDLGVRVHDGGSFLMPP